VFKFITRQHFLVNLIAAAVLLFGLVFAFLSMLDLITQHNQYEKVPSVAKMTLEQAIDALENKGFKVEVMAKKSRIFPIQLTGVLLGLLQKIRIQLWNGCMKMILKVL
jgi:cytochrome c oxidase assembly protein Cox11